MVACELPAETILHRDFADGAFFVDSYRFPLRHDASVSNIFLAVFGHQPIWMKAILLVRVRVGALFGLNAASAAQVMHPVRQDSYRVGDSIGRWPIHFLEEQELVAGADDRHLDFRVSVLKRHTGEGGYAFVSTVCRAHNRAGRSYLLVIAPFHRWGVQRLISAAVEAGRL